MVGAPEDSIVLPQQSPDQMDRGSAPPGDDTAQNAAIAGLIESEIDIPDWVPAPGRVDWSDGSTSSVALVSAQSALAAAKRDYLNPTVHCHGCAAVHVVDVGLIQGRYNTTRGPATIPTWQFTLREGDVHIFRIAAEHAVFPPDRSTDIAHVTGEASSLQLEIELLIGSCTDKSSYGLATGESDVAVVVYSTVQVQSPPPTRSPGAFCSDPVGDTLTVPIAKPLGLRTVLDLWGSPQPLNWQYMPVHGN